MAVDAVRSTWPNVLIGAMAALVVSFIAIMIVVGAVIPPLVVFAILFALLAVGVARWPEKRWIFIVAAVLALQGNLDYADALNEIREKCPRAMPNPDIIDSVQETLAKYAGRPRYVPFQYK